MLAMHRLRCPCLLSTAAAAPAAAVAASEAAARSWPPAAQAPDQQALHRCHLALPCPEHPATAERVEKVKQAAAAELDRKVQALRALLHLPLPLAAPAAFAPAPTAPPSTLCRIWEVLRWKAWPVVQYQALAQRGLMQRAAPALRPMSLQQRWAERLAAAPWTAVQIKNLACQQADAALPAMLAWLRLATLEIQQAQEPAQAAALRWRRAAHAPTICAAERFPHRPPEASPCAAWAPLKACRRLKASPWSGQAPLKRRCCPVPRSNAQESDCRHSVAARRAPCQQSERAIGLTVAWRCCIQQR